MDCEYIRTLERWKLHSKTPVAFITTVKKNTHDEGAVWICYTCSSNSASSPSFSKQSVQWGGWIKLLPGGGRFFLRLREPDPNNSSRVDG